MARAQYPLPPFARHDDQRGSGLCAVVAFQHGTDIFPFQAHIGVAHECRRLYRRMGRPGIDERSYLDRGAGIGLGFGGQVAARGKIELNS